MNSVRVKSYAKINLTLDILGALGGYHMLDSVVASVDLCDVIVAKKRRDNLVSVTMHGEGSEAIAFENNNAARAAERFISAFQTEGADITVWKNIPVGAGLGGSSADVAGALNAMAKLYNIHDFAAVKGIADGLGSDCGYMLQGGWARISGRGEVVKKLDCKLKLDIGLLVPKRGVSTAECYRLSDGLPRGGLYSDLAENAAVKGDLEGLCKSLSNGLYGAAAKLNGEVEGCFKELESFAPLGVNMTGSGSGVYAVFENDEFLRYAQSRYRGKHRFIPTKTVLLSKEEKDG